MRPTASREQAIQGFHQALRPAIDRGEPWEQAAINTADDDDIEDVEELGKFVERCLKEGILTQV